MIGSFVISSFLISEAVVQRYSSKRLLKTHLLKSILLKRDFSAHIYFRQQFVRFLGTTFLQNTSGRLLLSSDILPILMAFTTEKSTKKPSESTTLNEI